MSIFRAEVDESTDILPTEDVSVILKNVVVFMMPIEFLAELRTFSSNWKQAQPETERIIKIKFSHLDDSSSFFSNSVLEKYSLGTDKPGGDDGGITTSMAVAIAASVAVVGLLLLSGRN